MIASETIGRLRTEEVGEPQVHDAPNKTVESVLTKQDEIIDKLNAILLAIETATDAATLFTELDTDAIKAQLAKLKFKV